MPDATSIHVACQKENAIINYKESSAAFVWIVVNEFKDTLNARTAVGEILDLFVNAYRD